MTDDKSLSFSSNRRCFSLIDDSREPNTCSSSSSSSSSDGGGGSNGGCSRGVAGVMSGSDDNDGGSCMI